ncbi:MAG: hypothetical protein LBL23_02345 [Coriobacteriales bacterium]|jgi:hypothetical protein|nr:hypothetical protein [Coriobacteriales bacterium]
MTEVVFTRERILELLSKLDAKMATEGVEATVFVVGGAAIALALDSTRVTTDIDGQFEEPALEQLIRQVAQEEGLPSDWLNHSINVVMSYFKKDKEPLDVFNGRMLSIQAASPQYVLAMKLASRRDKDVDDVVMLIEKLGLSSRDEVLSVAGRYFNADLSAAAWQREQIESFLDLIIEEGGPAYHVLNEKRLPEFSPLA